VGKPEWQLSSLTMAERSRLLLLSVAAIADPAVTPSPTSVGPTHGENSKSLQNELLGDEHGERMDTSAAGTAGRANPHLEAVGEVHRAAHT